MKRHARSRLTTAVLLLTVVLPVGSVGGMEAEDSYDRRRAAWVAAGHPTDPHELLPERVPSRHNAATYYLRAGKRVEQLPAEYVRALHEPWKSDKLSELSLQLRPILEIYEKGRACETCVWPIEVDDPRELGSTSLAIGEAMRGMARTYQAMILSEGEAGRSEEAMRLVEHGLEIANDMDAAPTATNLMLKSAIQQTVLTGYRLVFADPPLPENEVSRYLEETNIERDLQRAAELEVATWISAYEQGFFDDWLTDPEKEQAARAELAWLLEMTSKALAGEAESVQAAMEHTRPSPRVLYAGDWPPVPWFPLLRLKMWQGPLVLSQLGVELREYKAEHGRYPETYDMPIDPLTGKPFIYTKTEDGCVITSQIERRFPTEWRWEENAEAQW
jgi:hypothetical protein